MPSKSSDARRRELGAELRRRRERAGLTGVDLARRLGWAQSTVSRFEAGTGSFTEVNVTTYLAHCGVGAPEAARVLRLARETEDGYLVRRQSLRTLILHETTAQRITATSPLLVPGLLQTEDYAQAVIRLPGRSEAEIGSRVAIRMERQQVLRGWNPAKFTYFLYEAALRCPFGGNRVMNEQMLHLGFLADRPNITIRVVPFAAGQFAAIGGNVTLMEFTEHGPVAYLESPLADLFVENREALTKYRGYLNQLANDALGERQSRELLARFASEYDPPEGAR
ncbi:DUF5753 domain-containing protein [Amycolatopsis cihanbeyliensis]|uniref:Helix-turn-helix protein n=1 Tax=Amycolatopsis cihanbeyliensis TaxID=1128664 RepID=A0A542DM36_AMYCI|nr:DUF5753 domain-containing protein [Amycolatopsis cihanbeyliensis]TQJ04149.1 helix-turn-helix protein [Amycolatopsis cihanbeyliensis]